MEGDHNLDENEPFRSGNNNRRNEAIRMVDQHQRNQILSLFLSNASLNEEIPINKNSGVSQQVIDSLDRIPKTRLRAGMKCPICTVEYIEEKYPLVIKLRCKHNFCLDCVTLWFKERDTCPICRAKAVKEESERAHYKEDSIDMYS